MRFNANRTFWVANNILDREIERVNVRETRRSFALTPPSPLLPLRPRETLVICRAINYAQVLIIFTFYHFAILLLP